MTPEYKKAFEKIVLNSEYPNHIPNVTFLYPKQTTEKVTDTGKEILRSLLVEFPIVS